MFNSLFTRTTRYFPVRLLSGYVLTQHAVAAPPQVHDLALLLVELYVVPVSPFLQLVQGHLDDEPFLPFLSFEEVIHEY